MATTTTTNIKLVKPDYSEAADVQVLNGNMDKIDAAFGETYNDLGIVVNGNKAALSAAVGQFVILKNSTISGRSDGLYTAAKAIPANTVIDSTYLIAVPGGGLNSLNSNLTNKIKRKTITVSCVAETWQFIPLTTLSQYGIDETKIINIIPSYGRGKWIVWRMANSNISFLRLNTSETNIVVDNTAGDFSLDIIYTDNIASSN